MKGIKGFWNRIDSEKVKFTEKVQFPDASKIGRWPPNIITVGKAGEMYATLKEAANSIRDSGVYNQYALLISGGYFDGGFALPPYVHLISLADAVITSKFTISGGSCYIDRVRLLPVFGDILDMEGASVTFIYSRILGGLNFTGNGALSLISCDGTFNIQLLGTNAISTELWGTEMTGNFRKVTSGLWQLIMQNSRITGQIYAEKAEHRFKIYNSQIVNIGSLSPIKLEAGVAGSYLHLGHSTLVSNPAVPTVDKSGGVGNIEAWTYLNGLTSAYANVNENIVAGGNIIDAGIV